jgi:hypothetical protein
MAIEFSGDLPPGGDGWLALGRAGNVTCFASSQPPEPGEPEPVPRCGATSGTTRSGAPSRAHRAAAGRTGKSQQASTRSTPGRTTLNSTGA